MKHPSESELALMAGGELGFFDKRRVRRHLDECSDCRATSLAFARDRELVRDWAGELPANLNWNRLAVEMKANIHVGVEADECVAAVGRSFAFGSRQALALASAVLTVVLGLWLNLPQPAPVPVANKADVTLEATGVGIELKQDNRSLTLLNPGSEPVAVSVNMQGVLRARYVDSETGHVTITNVYAQ
ncbi:MAG: zf-HC2 domain-containing protein [Acidobacteriales bacterium]|nr:zf-HC2 domain-containing protein [Terriglobales bacterium]